MIEVAFDIKRTMKSTKRLCKFKHCAVQEAFVGDKKVNQLDGYVTAQQGTRGMQEMTATHVICMSLSKCLD